MDIQVYCAHSRMVDIEAMVENPRNPNKHSDKQISLLAKIIKSQGWRNPIVVSNRSGFIVKGHCRLAAARLLGVESVPVDYQDYETEAAEWADMIADNRIAELAVADDKELRALLSELEGQIDLELTGFSGVSLEDLLSEPEVIDEEAEAEKVKMQKLELTERMDKAKYVFWAFSGGRDSTRALIATWEAFAATGKHCKVIYIESVVGSEDYILVRGGQPKQKTSRSGTAEMQAIKSKPNMIIYNPAKRIHDRVYETCAEKSERKHVTGADITDAFELGAERTLAICRRYGIRKAILAKWSPSCDASGVTGKLLRENGIEVINVF